MAQCVLAPPSPPPPRTFNRIQRHPGNASVYGHDVRLHVTDALGEDSHASVLLQARGYGFERASIGCRAGSAARRRILCSVNGDRSSPTQNCAHDGQLEQGGFANKADGEIGNSHEESVTTMVWVWEAEGGFYMRRAPSSRAFG